MIDIPDATMMNSFDSGVYAVPLDIRAPATPISPVPVPYSDFSLPQMGPLSPGPFSPTASIFSADQGASLCDPFMNTPQIGSTNLFSSMTDVSTASMGHFNSGDRNCSTPSAAAATSEPGPDEEVVKAVVEELGFISLQLRYDMRVDIAANQAIRVTNPRKNVTLGLTGCGTQMAMVHPQGRVLQYNSRIEVQVENYPSIKNAKMWPKGISFTSNNRALVYLVDAAGARSTTDTFHDLYATNIADTIFNRSSQLLTSTYKATIDKCVRDLEAAQYWRTPDNELDCWTINDVSVKQTTDGLVTVERRHGNELFSLRTSPSNGKVRLASSFVYLTASMGEEAHVFVKSNERRIHYNGAAFVVRNAGHSAGFDETGLLRIW